MLVRQLRLKQCYLPPKNILPAVNGSFLLILLIKNNEGYNQQMISHIGCDNKIIHNYSIRDPVFGDRIKMMSPEKCVFLSLNGYIILIDLGLKSVRYCKLQGQLRSLDTKLEVFPETQLLCIFQEQIRTSQFIFHKTMHRTPLLYAKYHIQYFDTKDF